MATPVKMPRLGESVAEGTVGVWLKKEGEYVEKDESLAEIITDKINAELPSPVAGRLTSILVQADETVAVGMDIALIEERVPMPALSGQEAEQSVSLSTESVVQGSVLTYVDTADEKEASLQLEQQRAQERARISPLAKRLAREHGIDLNQIAGTGAGGRVRKEDIYAYVATQQKVVPALASQENTLHFTDVLPPPASQGNRATAQPRVPDMTTSPVGPDEELLTPSRMRLSIAEHMVRSKRTSPHATTVVEVDMTNIAKWLGKNKEQFKQREGCGISYLPFVIKAVCEGIRRFPLINSTWTEDNKILIKRRINLGVAVATEEGLVVPTLYDADQYTLAGLAKQVSALAQRARTNKLTIQDVQNSTFVVTNPGVFGTVFSVPIINQPHAAILSMDAVVKRPVVIEDDAIAVRSMMYVSLSFDHRLLDGAGAAGFLQAVRTKLQQYGREIDIY